jgi:hypothetical protein
MVKSWNRKTTREMTEKMMERIMKACTALRASVGNRAGRIRVSGHPQRLTTPTAGRGLIF